MSQLPKTIARPKVARISVTIPRDLLKRARANEKVGTRGLSPLVVQMLEERFPKGAK